MPEERFQSEQEKAIRRYFHKPKKPSYSKAVIAMIAGGLLFLCGLSFLVGEGDSDFIGCLIPGVIVGVVGIVIAGVQNSSYQVDVKKGLPKPSDKEIDTWFNQGIGKLVEQSFGKLGLDNSDNEQREVVQDPLVIKGPILWSTNGIDSGDLTWQKGDDDIVRFGVYRVTIILLTRRHIASFACDYNFIKNVSLNERTDEYHYKDVVSVSTQEQASSYTLPTGIKLTTAQEFRLSVASGESIRVTIGAAEIAQITGSDKMPETGAEKAVAVIRAMLREKKE